MQEECALSMVQSLSDAASMVAQIMSPMEECARDMEQRSNYAAAMVARIKPSLEECAIGMEQSAMSNFAVAMDALL